MNKNVEKLRVKYLPFQLRFCNSVRVKEAVTLFIREKSIPNKAGPYVHIHGKINRYHNCIIIMCLNILLPLHTVSTSSEIVPESCGEL